MINKALKHIRQGTLSNVVFRKAMGKGKNLLRFLPSSYAINYLPVHDSVLIELDPLKINKIAQSSLLRVRMKRFFFREKTETAFKAIKPDEFHPTIRELWIEGKSYEETSQYAKMIEAVDLYQRGDCAKPSEIGAYWCLSRNDVDRYFQILNGCYESIKQKGYLTQNQLLNEDNKKGRGCVVRNLGDEIRVLIDSSGDIVFVPYSANHRFSIARFLKVNKVTAILMGVSRTWLEREVGITGLGYTHLLDKAIAKHNDIDKFIPDKKDILEGEKNK